MSVKKWVSVLTFAGAVGSLLSMVWIGDWRFLWTTAILTVVSLGSFVMAEADEGRAKGE